ncbi:MAG: YqjF family protein [Haloarculaceae archaeon]
MASIATATGSDVLFAHWPVAPDDLAAAVPDPLAVEAFDGSGWVSALAIRLTTVGPGSAPPPASFPRVPQLNLRTYVTLDGEPGVYFFSLDSGARLAALFGRGAFGLPVTRARISARRRGERIVFRSRRAGDRSAAFDARYCPSGDPAPATPDTLAEFCVERDRYFLPAAEDRRPVACDRDGVVRVGRITREPWTLAPAEATVRQDGLFAAAGLPEPDGEPTLAYSPGFEMGVEPVESRAVGRGTPDAGPG